MGRRIPSSSEANAWHHHPAAPALVLSLLTVCIAATIGVVAALCASRHRKSPTPKSRPTSPSLPHPPSNKKVEETTNVAAVTVKMPPPPPPLPPTTAGAEKETYTGAAALHNPTADVPVTKPVSRRKLSVSLSMKLPEGLSRIRTGRKEQKPVAVVEESIWMKTIILGERCKIPSDDDDDDDSSFVLYDEKGNRQKNYHPRTPRSLPVSRTNSFVCRDIVPS